MSFADVTALGTANSNTSTAGLTITTTAVAEVGRLVIVATAWDNTATTDDAGRVDLRCTDSANNYWTCLGSITNGQGAAAGGAQVAMFCCVVQTQIASGGTITITNSTNRTAKAMSAHKFSIDHHGVAVADKDFAFMDAADPAAMTLPTIAAALPSREYLLLYAYACEGPSTDTYTFDSDYTQLARASNAGAGAAGMHIVWGYRIATLTTDTFDMSSDTTDRDAVSLYCALFEYDPLPFPLAGILDSAGRANENPISDGGNWEVTAATLPLQVVSNRITNGTAAASRSNRVQPHPGDQEVYFTNIAGNTASGMVLGVTCNVADAGSANWDGYQFASRFGADTHNNIRLERIVNAAVSRGLLSWIASASGLGGDGIGDPSEKYGLRRYGACLEVWFKSANRADWLFLIGFEEEGQLLGGKIGAVIVTTSGTMTGDDFGGGDLRSYLQQQQITVVDN